MTMEVLRLRFLEPGRIASVQTAHVGGFAVKHVTRGMPSDVSSAEENDIGSLFLVAQILVGL